MKHLPMVLMFAAAAAAAQNVVPREFPADAVPFADDKALEDAFAGKTYKVTLADGTGWRLQYKDNGYFFVNTTTGFNGSGKWKAQDAKICGALKGAPSSCTEVRHLGDVLYEKRDSGEIIRMTPQ